MDDQAVFLALETACEDAIDALMELISVGEKEAACRLLKSVRHIQGHGRAIQPIVKRFTAVFHHFDLDDETPGNGYRTLVKVVRCCLLHIVHKARYVSANCSGALFRAEHNAGELEAYGTALGQLRAMLCLGQRLLGENGTEQLYSSHDQGLSRTFVHEYTSLHKASFYGRCLGFQFSPALRPFFQTVVISMVSFGENWKRRHSGLGRAALSVLTSGKYVVDPELRGAEFERITQNLDMHFWKTFWNLTESELLSGLASIASNTVQVNVTLSVPPVSLRMPLASDPGLSVTVQPPVAHWGPDHVKMRLISYDLREGQDSEELLAFSRSESSSGSRVFPSAFRSQRAPASPWLIVHFHGGGFVAQTSKSHESYLKSWSRDLDAPVLSVDYSLAPEAPFPRALEECFYAYCWALQNCHLLGSTAERVCLAGDSAGGNLCITVSMRAMTNGVRVPDGIMAAYPATLLTADASPSRLLTLIDPMLPLGVLCKCMNAYAGAECQTVEPSVEAGPLGTLGALSRDTALLLTDITQGASNWLQSLLDSSSTSSSSSSSSSKPSTTPQGSQRVGKSQGTLLLDDKPLEYPDGFMPLRSERLSEVRTPCSPILRNPFASPLLAPDSLLKGLPPLHIVVSALDAMLDDSVMFAKRLRSISQPVTLTIVEDLPHGFLSLSQLSKETQEALTICTKRIREVFEQAPPSVVNNWPKAPNSNHVTKVIEPIGFYIEDEEVSD